MIVRTLVTTAAALALVATAASAQKVVSTKMGDGGSPHETVEWAVGGAKITLTYGRPFLKARKVLTDVAPEGKVWRTGADAATTLTTDKTLMIGTLMIPPGTYTLYTVPGAKTWKLAVSKQTGQWGPRRASATCRKSRRCIASSRWTNTCASRGACTR